MKPFLVKLHCVLNVWTHFILPFASSFAGGVGAGLGAGSETAICAGMHASSTKSPVKYN